MPLYEYCCNVCGFEFEELRKTGEDRETLCKMCGSPAKRKMSRFAAVIAGGSPTESIDMSIGREAEKRWSLYEDRQSKRRGGKKLENVAIPKTRDGQFMPVMALGDNRERAKREEYSSALQEHRQKRIKKGQPQFDGVGAF